MSSTCEADEAHASNTGTCSIISVDSLLSFDANIRCVSSFEPMKLRWRCKACKIICELPLINPIWGFGLGSCCSWFSDWIVQIEKWRKARINVSTREMLMKLLCLDPVRSVSDSYSFWIDRFFLFGDWSCLSFEAQTFCYAHSVAMPAPLSSFLPWPISIFSLDFFVGFSCYWLGLVN